MGFPGDSDAKESGCSAGDLGLIPGLGRSPGEGNDYPLQYSCLKYSRQDEPGGVNPWGHKQLDMRLTNTHACN